MTPQAIAQGMVYAMGTLSVSAAVFFGMARDWPRFLYYVAGAIINYSVLLMGVKP